MPRSLSEDEAMRLAPLSYVAVRLETATAIARLISWDSDYGSWHAWLRLSPGCAGNSQDWEMAFIKPEEIVSSVPSPMLADEDYDDDDPY